MGQEQQSYLLQTCDGVGVSLHQAGVGLGLRLCRAGDLQKTPAHTARFETELTTVKWFSSGAGACVQVFTSIEQPIMEPLSRAFFKMENRLSGAFAVSYISPTPPVKSSMASSVEPPFRDS